MKSAADGGARRVTCVAAGASQVTRIVRGVD